MKKPKATTIKEALTLLGWKEDAYGHMQCTTKTGKKYRVKMQATSVRLEVKNVELGEWVRVKSAYMKDVVLTEDGCVVVDKVVLKPLGKD